MDLLERYLAAIRRNLPQGKADDIVAELADDLHSRREEREDRLGRGLTEDETSVMLRDFGHPLVIAARYRPHQYLIGPQTYPFYMFTMKIVLAVGAALLIGLSLIGLVLGDRTAFQTLARASDDLWSFFFLAVTLVTIVFAVLERNHFPADHLRRWTPKQLPDVFDRPKSQWEAALEVGFGIAFLLWWTGFVGFPDFGMHDQVRIVSAPIWTDFHLPILLLAVAQLALALLTLVRPRWKTARAILTIALSIAALAIIAGLYRAGSWVIVTAASVDAREATAIAVSLDLAVRIALIVVAVMMVLQALGELWKLLRPKLAAAGI